MIEKVRDLVLKEIEGKGWNWENHIKGVVRYGKLYAEDAGADPEIVELACWLHDIAKVRDGGKDHHLKGAEMARQVCLDVGYPHETADSVAEAITTHSSDPAYPPKTPEQKALATADAMSHFEMFWELCWYCYNMKGMSVEEGKAFLRRKYSVAWKKLIPAAKADTKKQYDAIMAMLDS